mgnify:CR=1 FL=1|tara:strand:+ start:2018 stop:3505 length:1488 start_codon:yes stop_codon:yes gene_type:complete
MVLIRLLLIKLISLFLCVSVLAEDVYIVHNNYGNTHSKWKNRLEDAGHTVTSSQNTLSDYSGYEQVLDLRFLNSHTFDTDDYKAVLQSGGTIILNGENSNAVFRTRNTAIQDFIRDVTGDNTVTYSTSLNINYSGTNEQLNTTSVLSTLPSDWAYFNFALGGVITTGVNGKCLAQNSQGYCGVALFDGDALSSNYANGKIIVFTDINYASHSQYYTADNKEFLTALISDVTTSTVSTTTVSYSSAPTSAQTQDRTTTRNITSSNNSIYINQSGNNLDLDIIQNDDNQLIAGLGTTSGSIDPAEVHGNNNTINIEQGNSSGSFSDGNVVLFDINGDHNSMTIRQGDNLNDDGDHRLKLNVVGNTNTGNFTQEEDGAVGNQGHFMNVDIAGNSNTLDIDQNNDGDKMIFVDINGDSNTLDLDQTGTGQHFQDVTVGSNQTVSINQNGSGDHAATINMSGNSATLDLTQSGSTDKTYSLTQNCTNGSGCGTTTVNQSN